MEQIAPLLEDLAAQLGTTVEYLWPMFVAKTKIQYVMFLILVSTLFAISSFVSWRSLVAGKADDWDDGAWFPAVVISGVAFGFFGAALFDALTRLWILWYPEVQAIENLIEMIGG
jgi:hypothetical protein